MLHHKKNISVMGDIFCFMLKIPSLQHSNPAQLLGLYYSAWLCDSAPSALNFLASFSEDINKSSCMLKRSKDFID